MPHEPTRMRHALSDTEKLFVPVDIGLLAKKRARVPRGKPVRGAPYSMEDSLAKGAAVAKRTNEAVADSVGCMAFALGVASTSSVFRTSPP